MIARAALAGAAALAGLFSSGARPIDTGDTPPAMLRAETCAPCHERQYAQWKRSRHAAAWTNGLFQRDYRQSRRAWCRNCHIPLAAQQRAWAAGDATLAEQGVNCAACHVRDGRIVARARGAGSPHDTAVDAAFGTAEFCAGCHQFAFPRFDGGAFAGYTSEPMQDTVAQFRRNPRRPASCLACHGGGHRFPGAHDPAMLRRALAFYVCRDGAAVRATVTNAGAGHNVPTGDVHRHVVVRAWYSTAPERLRDAFFGRRFALAGDGTKTTIWDSTIPPGATRRWRIDPAALGPPATAREPLNVELRYVYANREDIADEVGEPVVFPIARVRSRPEDLPPCAR